ncbi:MAG: amidohydrolase family protein [Candidatus Marinimicrobia bacterium]|nr:amidohydrolase family protein [Candidatus Neomarinimicrobiota bacterium]
MNKHESLILTNATITDGFSFLIENGAVEIENDRITQIGKCNDLQNPDVETIDLQGRLALPGLLNPHHHLYSALATGLAPIGPIENFTQILGNLWWHLDQKLDEESIYYSAVHGLLQSVKYGVTTIFDHHASMNGVSGSLAIIEKAFRKVGLKGLLCHEISDRMGESAVQAQVDENMEFWAAHRQDSHVQGLLGLHANFTLSENTLVSIQKQKPAELPIHIHCGEDCADYQYCIDHGYAGPVDRLNEFGLLSGESFLAHCIHLSEKDYELIREIQPVVISNPESNANNNVGVMDIAKIEKYILGTDGMTGNILGTMRSHFLQRNGKIDQPLDILFRYPAEIVQRFFPDAGALEIGRRADLAITDYIPVTDINLDNLFYHLIFGVQGQPMYMTIADGKILYQGGEFKNFYEYETLNQIKHVADKLHRKYYE